MKCSSVLCHNKLSLQNFFFWKNFLLSLNYNAFYCSSTVVFIFSPPLPWPHPSPPPTLDPTPLWLCPHALYTCLLTTPLLFRYPSPLWLPPAWAWLQQGLTRWTALTWGGRQNQIMLITIAIIYWVPTLWQVFWWML